VTLPVFVVPPGALAADSVTLDGDEGRHAVVVKRIRVGEHLVLTDGRGESAECEVMSVAKGSLVADVVVRRSTSPAQPRLVVVQAIPKGDHAERAVDLLTEIGADVIVPWAAERNVVTWKGDRGAKALNRWRSIALAAAKQSRRVWHPEVLDLHSTQDVAGLVEHAVAAYVLTRSGNASRVVINVLSVALVLGSLAVAVQTYRVGDSGARAVWSATSTAGVGSASEDG